MNTRRKLTYVASIVCVGLVLAASWFALATKGQTNASSDGERWEYLIVGGGGVSLTSMGGPAGLRKQKVFQNEAATVERNLDKLGEEGWMLVAVVGSPADPAFFLKRPTRK